MISHIKFHLRQKRAAGEFVTLINVLANINYKYKNLKQWFARNKAFEQIQNIDLNNDRTDWVNFIFNCSNGFFKPIQNQWEIKQLINQISTIKPEHVLEIGTANGGTLFLLARASSPTANLISLDLPYGKNGGGFPTWKTPLYKKFSSSEQNIHFIRANSHHESTKKIVEQKSENNLFDIIMIDADHSYEGVKRDFELYSSLTKSGGLVILHDIIPNRFDPEINVDKFWEELKQNYKTTEIVHDYNQGNLGLGIVYM